MLTSITTQPATNQLFAAYRPIPFLVRLTTYTGAESVYCDIYFSNQFYKTISSTLYVDKVGGGADFSFDIQDAAQEYLFAQVPVLIPDVQVAPSGFTTCFCKFRGSSVDANGIITQEGTIPVQGSYGVPPVAGGGVQSNTISILNASLLHEDNQDLLQHLRLNWPYSNTPGFIAYLLSHKTDKIYDRSSQLLNTYEGGYFPLFFNYGAFNNTDSGNIQIWLLSVANTNLIYPLGTGTQPYSAPGVYYIPYTKKTFKTMAGWNAIPAETQNAYYVIVRQYISFAGTMVFRILWQSPPVITLPNFGEGRRIAFLNRLGHYDSVTFSTVDETLKVTSSTMQIPLTIAPTQFNKYLVGHSRFNIQSNENNVLQGVFDESEMAWLKELFESPKAYIEMKGTQGQDDYYLPIVLLDAESATRTTTDRYSYLVTIQYAPANDHIVIRN